MRKLILPGLAALFFMMAAGFPISFAESGGFEVPKVDDHFEEVKPGPGPADEATGLTGSEEREPFFRKIG